MTYGFDGVCVRVNMYMSHYFYFCFKQWIKNALFNLSVMWCV